VIVEQNIRLDPARQRSANACANSVANVPPSKRYWAKVIVDLAAFISRNRTGNVSSPFSKTSIRLPAVIGASV
jgi:hypothetical protein